MINLIKKYNKKSILVIGDVMLDTYFLGKVSRVSPEAPIPVLNKKTERQVLGGAANVAANLTGIEQNVYMMSFIGKDNAGDKIVELLSNLNVDTSMMIRSSEIITTEKTRMLAQNNQQIMRLDQEEILNLTQEQENHAIKILEEKIVELDLIILSDYLKGVLNANFTKKIIEVANDNNVKVIIDVKDPSVEKYTNAFLLKPNLLELKSLTGMPVETFEEISKAGKVLCDKCNCQYVLATCGGDGMVLVKNDGESQKITCTAKEVYDVSGAGDTVISYLGAGIANDIKLIDAVNISNIAAGVKVSKVGTSIVYLEEVRAFLGFMDYSSVLKKLISKEEIPNILKINKGKKIVFTNGCFDILHSGHIRYLQKSATHGDILIVGVNDDASIKRLKGEERPINCLEDRLEVLSALEFIDYVIPFSEDTPIELIKAVKPDVLAKGADYTREEVVGYDVVEANGGCVALIDLVQGKSTTNIISKMKDGEN